MSPASHCSQCGHEIGIGRFCTNCGFPVASRSPQTPDDEDARDHTAIRPIGPPAGPSAGQDQSSDIESTQIRPRLPSWPGVGDGAPSTPPPLGPPPSGPPAPRVPQGPPLPPRPVIAPPVTSMPPAQRFPMWADESTRAPGAPTASEVRADSPATAAADSPGDSAIGGWPGSETGDSLIPGLRTDSQAALPAVSAPLPSAAASARRTSEPESRSRRGWLVGLAVAVVLVLVASFGGLLLTRGGDDPDSATDPGAAADLGGSEDEPQPSGSADGSQSPTPTSPATPKKTRTPKAKPQNVALAATVSAPQTAPPNQDVSGAKVTYAAANMLDDIATTCWRMPGDGSGQTLTFTLREPTELRRVGMINGYAKRDGGFDWYSGNRRVTSAEWIFDDGSSVTQSLGDKRGMQTIGVDKVVTSSVQLRLTSVSAPGKGRSSRDYTAISDVQLTGVPAG